MCRLVQQESRSRDSPLLCGCWAVQAPRQTHLDTMGARGRANQPATSQSTLQPLSAARVRGLKPWYRAGNRCFQTSAPYLSFLLFQLRNLGTTGTPQPAASRRMTAARSLTPLPSALRSASDATLISYIPYNNYADVTTAHHTHHISQLPWRAQAQGPELIGELDNLPTQVNC